MAEELSEKRDKKLLSFEEDEEPSGFLETIEEQVSDSGIAADLHQPSNIPADLRVTKKISNKQDPLAPGAKEPGEDSPFDESPRHHQRNISWGNNNHVVESSSPSLTGLADTGQRPSQVDTHSPSIKNVVALEDVIKANPLEHEAETLILSVLERQESLRRHHPTGSDTGSAAISSILGNVPDTATNVFGEEHEELDEVQELVEPLAEMEASVENEDKSSVASSAHTVMSVKNAPGHRRVQTMEEQLYGLSKALADIQPSPPLETIAGTETAAGNAALPTKATPQKDGAAAAFAHGAAVLLQRKKKRNDLESGSVAPTAGAASNDGDDKSTANQNWGLDTGAILVSPSQNGHKKNDDFFVEDVSDLPEEGPKPQDVEAGLETTTPAEPHQASDPRPPSARETSNKWRHRFSTAKPVQQTTGLASDFHSFTKQRSSALQMYCRFLLLIIVPATGVAAILFYLRDNPPTGKAEPDSVRVKPTETYYYNLTMSLNWTSIGAPPVTDDKEKEKASASWWILFICVRQIIVFSLARLTEAIIIDFFCLSSRVAVNLFGQLITLFIVQSKGWPFQISCWAILCFALLWGESEFAQHWLFFQDEIELFSKRNPSGSVTSDEWYFRVLSIAVSVGLIVSAKRLWLGFYLGKKIFNNYAEDLASVMKKIILLSRVGIMARSLSQEAFLANQLRREPRSMRSLGISKEKFTGLIRSTINDDEGNADEQEAEKDGQGHTVNFDSGFIVDPSDHKRDGLTPEQQTKVEELLGCWEEPVKEYGPGEDVSISAILQFRASLVLLENPFMFSIAWGDVRTRERMILSTQKVFKRINLRTPDTTTVRFDILARVALDQNGVLDLEMLEELIRLLRPDRDGSLSLLDFAKSVDAVYKEAKLLRGAIHNSEQIDLAFEVVINAVFYIIMATIILNQLGFDPLALFLSLSSIIVAFAFMVGSASSKMFEGWLFILLRRPYDIGDRIHVSSVNSDTSPSGSPGWIVKDVTLFTTTVVFGTTNERATISNGSMASSRIINMTRSPQAVLYVYLKFSTATSFEKIQILEQAVRKFVIARPREWANFIGFRPTEICADLGYVEYILILQHRESWANIGALKASQSEVASFCHELSKKMDMRYRSPPMPVHLAFMNQLQGTRDPKQNPTLMERSQKTRSEPLPNLQQATAVDPAAAEPIDIGSVVELFENSRKSKEY